MNVLESVVQREIPEVKELSVYDEKGKERAFAELQYVFHPFPLCMVKNLEIVERDQADRTHVYESGKNFGTQMVMKVNEFLNQHDMVGLLDDGAKINVEMWDIHSRVSFVEKVYIPHFYTNRGWEAAPDGTSWRMYKAKEHGRTYQEVRDAYFKYIA